MKSRRLHGFSGAVAGLTLAVLVAMILSRAWSACDAGVNNTANTGFLVFLFIPVVWMVLLLGWLAVGAFLGDRPLLRTLALVAVISSVSWCALSLFWSGNTYACPTGVPPWWPSFFPTPGF